MNAIATDPAADPAADRVSLAERMKTAEHGYRRHIDTGQYLLLRLDGRAFHSYTCGLMRPYDADFGEAMNATLLALCNEIDGVRLGYVQSDEISLLLTDWTRVPHDTPTPATAAAATSPAELSGSRLWMGGVEAKILSLSAARASVAFNIIRLQQHHSPAHQRRQPRPDGGGGALFDSRLWTFPATPRGRTEVANYFLWRQRDAVKNSVSMAAQTHFSHRRLLGVNTSDKQDLLREAGHPWETLPAGFRYGRVASRVPQAGSVTFTDKRTGIESTTTVTRRPFVLQDAPTLSPGAPYLEDLIPPALRD